MIKHIVLFRINEFQEGIGSKDSIDQLADCFRPLEKGPFSIEYRVGANRSKSENAWHVAIDSLFETEADLESYSVSSEHQEAIKKASRFKKEKAVIDYKY